MNRWRSNVLHTGHLAPLRCLTTPPGMKSSTADSQTLQKHPEMPFHACGTFNSMLLIRPILLVDARSDSLASSSLKLRIRMGRGLIQAFGIPFQRDASALPNQHGLYLVELARDEDQTIHLALSNGTGKPLSNVLLARSTGRVNDEQIERSRRQEIHVPIQPQMPTSCSCTRTEVTDFVYTLELMHQWLGGVDVHSLDLSLRAPVTEIPDNVKKWARTGGRIDPRWRSSPHRLKRRVNRCDGL